MDINEHVPSLTHLASFVKARSRSRATHVARDREQVTAPRENRFFGFAYEKFITAMIAYVADGCRGPALRRAVEGASDRMRPSYEAAAAGITKALRAIQPSTATRRQHSIVVVDPRDQLELVSLRVHLRLTTTDAECSYAFLYFPDVRLAEVEESLIETAVGLAVRQIDPTALALIINVRQGNVRTIDPESALTEQRVNFLRSESVSYRAEWVAAA